MAFEIASIHSSRSSLLSGHIINIRSGVRTKSPNDFLWNFPTTAKSSTTMPFGLSDFKKERVIIIEYQIILQAASTFSLLKYVKVCPLSTNHLYIPVRTLNNIRRKNLLVQFLRLAPFLRRYPHLETTNGAGCTNEWRTDWSWGWNVVKKLFPFLLSLLLLLLLAFVWSTPSLFASVFRASDGLTSGSDFFLSASIGSRGLTNSCGTQPKFPQCSPFHHPKMH